MPLALYFVWERREKLAAMTPRPSLLGAGVLAGGLLLLVVGSVGAELFLQRFSLIVVLAGLVWLILGTAFLRELLFPLAFLVFMIPLPSIVMNAIAFPLQLFAAQSATFCMEVAGIPVLREGNTIVLANTTLEVVEACSGIRSLQALLALGAVYGYFTQKALWKKWALLVPLDPDRDPGERVSRGGDGVPGALHRARGGAGLLPLLRGVDRLRGRLRAPARGRAHCSARLPDAASAAVEKTAEVPS